jgi:hypothetical protein
MNIFTTSPDPNHSAIVLPDKLIVKMPVETCQLLSIVASPWFHNYGKLIKKDGHFYNTERGAFKNHPCTKWAAESIHNAYWLIRHGLSLCDEYQYRYGKVHGCTETLLGAYDLFPKGALNLVTPFVRAMPDELKYDTTIDTFTAYKNYINTKPWVASNYLRVPTRKPDWIN